MDSPLFEIKVTQARKVIGDFENLLKDSNYQSLSRKFKMLTIELSNGIYELYRLHKTMGIKYPPETETIEMTFLYLSAYDGFDMSLSKDNYIDKAIEFSKKLSGWCDIAESNTILVFHNQIIGFRELKKIVREGIGETIDTLEYEIDEKEGQVKLVNERVEKANKEYEEFKNAKLVQKMEDKNFNQHRKEDEKTNSKMSIAGVGLVLILISLAVYFAM
tara:strand:+ start:93 stop:746 length:654 start_codon:yes stop_codon:yes gene_type:complete